MPNNICAVEECDRVVLARGMCGKHYQRWRRWGDVHKSIQGQRPLVPIADRIWPKVDKCGPVPEFAPHLGRCWVWTGARSSGGYGHVGAGGSGAPMVLVHRWVYEQATAPIPPGTEMDHLCRVRHCCN